METLEKLKTGQLNLLLDFFNDQLSLVRQPLKQVEDRLDKNLKDFYTEFTENILELRGVDLRSYSKSVYYALSQVDLKGYSTSISFTSGVKDLVKFRRLYPYKFMASLRYPVTSLYDEGMDSALKTSRLIHVLELMEHLRKKMEEAQNFVEKTYTQAESINRHQCGMTDSISEKLIRYREDLFLEAISLFRSREKWKDRPKAYTELLQIIHETLTYFEKEIRYNYYTLNHNITRPYLLQVQALIREISEEFPELVTVQWKCLLYGIELYLEEQLVAPYLQDIQDLLNGSEFERLLMHLHDNYFWRKKIEVLDDDVEWVLSFITDLDMREDTKRKMISMLKKPMNSWPEKYREIAKNLEAFYLRFRDLGSYKESIKDSYNYPGF